MMAIAAEFNHVVKRYPTGFLGGAGIDAVCDVTLAIPQGRIFALLGPNRAGKTTLIKMLLTLTRPTQGIITRLGEPVKNRRTLARVGYMHENQAFPRYLSAVEVLRFYGGLSGLSAKWLDDRVSQLLEKVGLADRACEPIRQFSKGMLQRLGLAQALLNDPELLILDEPTEGLDIGGRQLLRTVIQERRAAGKTVILVTHALSEVEELAEELAVLVKGKVAYRGRVEELLAGASRDSGGRNLEISLRDVYERGASE
jgi:ABC-2 type transport system ATP-binding protein